MALAACGVNATTFDLAEAEAVEESLGKVQTSAGPCN